MEHPKELTIRYLVAESDGHDGDLEEDAPCVDEEGFVLLTAFVRQGTIVTSSS